MKLSLKQNFIIIEWKYMIKQKYETVVDQKWLKKEMPQALPGNE